MDHLQIFSVAAGPAELHIRAEQRQILYDILALLADSHAQLKALIEVKGQTEVCRQLVIGLHGIGEDLAVLLALVPFQHTDGVIIGPAVVRILQHPVFFQQLGGGPHGAGLLVVDISKKQGDAMAAQARAVYGLTASALIPDGAAIAP